MKPLPETSSAVFFHRTPSKIISSTGLNQSGEAKLKKDGSKMAKSVLLFILKNLMTLSKMQLNISLIYTVKLILIIAEK